jgi:hypothetical protein
VQNLYYISLFEAWLNRKKNRKLDGSVCRGLLKRLIDKCTISWSFSRFVRKNRKLEGSVKRAVETVNSVILHVLLHFPKAEVWYIDRLDCFVVAFCCYNNNSER